MPSIVLKISNKTFQYSTVETEIKNAIGKVSAILLEYNITDCDEGSANVFCKLYKTKEGFWYDPATENEQVDNKTKYFIKSAIDAVENEHIASKRYHI